MIRIKINKASQLIWGAFFAFLCLIPTNGCSERPKRPLTAIELGKKVYYRRCYTCHQANGRGYVGKQQLAADLTLNPGVMDQPDEKLSKTIKTGITGPIGKMPPLGPVLSDQEIAAVITYVRQTFQAQDNRPGP